MAVMLNLILLFVMIYFTVKGMKAYLKRKIVAHIQKRARAINATLRTTTLHTADDVVNMRFAKVVNR